MLIDIWAYPGAAPETPEERVWEEKQLFFGAQKGTLLILGYWAT